MWTNQKVMISGGSKGLGRALAIEFLNQGAQVVVLARQLEGLEELKREFPKIQILEGDVGNPQEIPYIAAETLTLLGGLDILVNCASSLGPVPLKWLVDTECEDFEAALRVNLLGPFRLTKALITPMLLNQRGRVINVTSDASIQHYPSWGAYGASKAALDHMTQTFAEELAGTGVRFLAVDPGDMDTELHHSAIPEADRNTLRKPEQSAALLMAYLEAPVSQEGLNSVRVKL